MKKLIKLRNIKSYFLGNFRYTLYYSRLRFLIREHIREQIEFRIQFMQKVCYENGMCEICGCATTALQMAGRQCDKPCYPTMINDRNEWRMFYRYGSLIKEGEYYWRYYPHKNILQRFNREETINIPVQNLF